MKTTAAILTLAALSALPAQAEYFRPYHGTSYGLSFSSGHHRGHHGHHGHHGRHFSDHYYGHRYSDYGYRPYHGYGYSTPIYYADSRDTYATNTRSSRAANGLILGGLAGAIIGHNSGDLGNNAWRGAALGAGAGWLLGAISDKRAANRERSAQVESSNTSVGSVGETPAPATPTQTTVPQTVIINNYYGPTNAMSSANSLFGR